MNEGLHPQNWRLEVGKGKKGPELGSDGLAVDKAALQKQLEEAQRLLEKAKADRADLDDIPQLSEDSQIKVEDLPVASDEDKAFLNKEVAQAQERLDKIQAKWEVVEAVDKVKQNIDSIKDQISAIEQSKLTLADMKKTAAQLVGENSPLVTGFDLESEKLDGRIQALNVERSKLEVLLVLAEASLNGQISEGDAEQIREILKNGANSFDSETLNRATAIVEKIKRYQIKDAKELVQYREEAKNLRGEDLNKINKEIALLESSLQAAGINPDDQEQITRLIKLGEERGEVNGTDDEDESVARPEVRPDPEVKEAADSAEADFRAKFVETSGLLANLAAALNLNEDEAVKIIAQLESVVAEMATIIGQIKNAETKQKYQEIWEKKGVASKIEEAKKKLAPETDAVDAEEVVDPEKEESAIENIANRLKDAVAKTDVQEIRRLIGATRQFVDYGKSELDSMDDSDERIKLEAEIAAAESLIAEAEQRALELDDEATKEQSTPRLAKIFKGIRNRFTGLVGWFNRNAGGRDEAVPVGDGEGGAEESESETESAADGAAETSAKTENNKEESQKIYELQSRSLVRIEQEIKDILLRKGKNEAQANDIQKFAFALDSLYLIDLEVVNDKDTRLTESDQKELNGHIDQISEALEDGFGKNWDVIVQEMEGEVEEKETLLDETEDRRNWFMRFFNGSEDTGEGAPAVNEQTEDSGSLADGVKGTEEPRPTEVPGLKKLNL